MTLFDKFLKLSISLQIRVGIICVILFAVSILSSLLIISTLIQFNTMQNYYHQIIEKENDNMLLNVEQYVFSVEDLIMINSKRDLRFLSLLQKNYFASLECLEMSDLLNNYEIKDEKMYEVDTESEDYNNCFNSTDIKCLVYKFINKDSSSGSSENITLNNISFAQLKIYYNVIFPLLKNIIQKKMVATHPFNLYKNFQLQQKIDDSRSIVLYMSNKITPFDVNYSYQSYKMNILKEIQDYFFNIYSIIPYLNNKIQFKDIILNISDETYSNPLVLSSYLFENKTYIPYKKYYSDESKNNFYLNQMDFETQLLLFDEKDNYLITLIESLGNNTQSMMNNFDTIIEKFFEYFNSISIFGWSDAVLDNIMRILIGQYYLKSNVYVIVHSAFSIFKKAFLSNITTGGLDSNLNIIFDRRTIFNQFSCIFVAKNYQYKLSDNFTYDHNSINITYCEIKFSDDFNEYLDKENTEMSFDEREKINVEIVYVNITYDYFTYEDGEQISVEKDKKIFYDKSEQKDKNLAKAIYSFKIARGLYPIDSLNYFKSQFYRNFLSMNFYLSRSLDNFENKNIVTNSCQLFFEIIIIVNAALWGAVIIVIIIIVFRISHSISDPIDRLIQSVSMNDVHGKSNDGLKNYLKNISYKDDTTINDLFLLCKKLILGAQQGEEEVLEDIPQKNKTKKINPYNNICLVKTNNMIIDEIEIIKGEKKQEINFFEKNEDDKVSRGKINKNCEFLSTKNNFNYKVLSGPLFTGKFLKWNKGFLIKEKKFYDLVANDNSNTFSISKKKKANAEDH